MFAYIISIYCPCSCTMQFTGGVVYCDFNLPGCSRTMVLICQSIFAYHDFNLPDDIAYNDFNLPEDIRVPWFQFTGVYSRTMIPIYQMKLAYHDFILPEDVRVPWLQFTTGCLRTMSSIMTFAYHEFKLSEDVRVPWFQFTRGCLRTMVSIYQICSRTMISIYRHVRVPWFNLPNQ